MALESAHALAALGMRATASAEAAAAEPGIVQLPHADGLVEGAGDEGGAAGGEGDGVDRVLVALVAFGALDEHAGLRVPDADALV